MRLKNWLQNWLSRPWMGRRARQTAPRRRGRQLVLEQLEDSTVPSHFTAASVADLNADSNAAHKHGGSNTITLAAHSTNGHSNKCYDACVAAGGDSTTCYYIGISPC
jgi:hypothetical protein